MSRGPGKIERAIRGLMDNRPDGAWTIEDLIDQVYRGINRPEKKHRVSVLRSVKNVVRKAQDWVLSQSDQRGGTLVLVNYANVESYALGRLKKDFAHDYRRPNCDWAETESQLLERLQPGGSDHHLIVPGGAWHRHVQMYIAKRDGQTETLEALKEQQREALSRSRLKP